MGGKGGGVREGAAEGPRPGGPGVLSVVLSPLWGGGERRESRGHGGRAAVGPAGKGGEGCEVRVLGCRRGGGSREGLGNVAVGELRGTAGLPAGCRG